MNHLLEIVLFGFAALGLFSNSRCWKVKGKVRHCFVFWEKKSWWQMEKNIQKTKITSISALSSSEMNENSMAPDIILPMQPSLLLLSEVVQAEMLTWQLLKLGISVIKPLLSWDVEKGAGETYWLSFHLMWGWGGLGSSDCSGFCLLLFVD